MPFRIIRKLIPSIYIAPFFQIVKGLSRNHLINLWFSCRVVINQDVCLCVCIVCTYISFLLPFLPFSLSAPLSSFIFHSTNVSYFLNVSWLELGILLSLCFKHLHTSFRILSHIYLERWSFLEKNKVQRILPIHIRPLNKYCYQKCY